MKKKDYYKEMPSEFSGYLDRYVEEYLQDDTGNVRHKAAQVYKRFYNETPEIGGKENPMADNLYEFMSFMAYYEATEHRMGEDAIPVVVGWLIDDKEKAARFLNLNNPFCAALVRAFFNIVVKKTEKKRAKGEWLHSWEILSNPENRKEGCCYTLIGCPLLAFAKAHGYEEMMPKFCIIDHDSARVFHAKLVRFQTEATGGDRCDYWFIGDQSKTLEAYADLERK